METVNQLIQKAESEFSKVGIDTPRLDAEVLLAHVLNCDRAHLYGHPEEKLSEDGFQLFRNLVSRRLKREPVAYIIGKKEFWDREFEICHGVLVPRPDTEALIEEVLSICKTAKPCPTEYPKIIDIGVGSGNIAITLACELPEARVWGTDSSDTAIKLATKNAKTHGVSSRVHLLKGSLFDPLAEQSLLGSVDFIVSNPPYIPSVRIPELAPEITKFEPIETIDGGPNGLSVIEPILNKAPSFLKDGGYLVMEIDPEEVEQIREMANSSGGWKDIKIKKDLGGRDRIITLKNIE